MLRHFQRGRRQCHGSHRELWSSYFLIGPIPAQGGNGAMVLYFFIETLGTLAGLKQIRDILRETWYSKGLEKKNYFHLLYIFIQFSLRSRRENHFSIKFCREIHRSTAENHSHRRAHRWAHRFGRWGRIVFRTIIELYYNIIMLYGVCCTWFYYSTIFYGIMYILLVC